METRHLDLLQLTANVAGWQGLGVATLTKIVGVNRALLCAFAAYIQQIR